MGEKCAADGDSGEEVGESIDIDDSEDQFAL